MITLENICKIYDRGRVEALRGVSLTVSRGDYLSVTGASGSGKTTLMHILGLLDAPTSGRYLLDGEDVSQLPPEARARLRGQAVGFVFQSFRLLQDLTALENAALPLAFQGVPERVRLARARELLEAVGLAGREGHRPKALSGGQQQRVAIARALATGPRLLLADEPTAGLDPEAASGVLALFDRLHKSGHTLILITHDPKAAARAARRASICAGKLKEEPHDQTGQDQLLP
ncbi:MAG: ABC transporter ATP-binding protein [Clostridiaceae bacterium]|nr:ABC transporter ATP-binding protein [Clostridiaceae bacterium]MDE7034874.1 ABC transporter ATP-binding protein [Eubacteriales bacterium]